MKTLEFNRNSWHFWLATRIASFKTYNGDEQNICSYLRSVLAGGFIIAAGSFLATVMTTVVVSAAYHWLGVLLGLIHRGPSKLEQCGTVFLGLFIIVYATYVLATAYKKRLDKTADAQPGFVVSAYRSWKDKTCVRVSFTEK